MEKNLVELRKKAVDLLGLLNERHPVYPAWKSDLADASAALSASLIGNALPDEWKKAIADGWEILPCTCVCGGRYAWWKPNQSGATEIFGCVCHNTPIGATLSEKFKTATNFLMEVQRQLIEVHGLKEHPQMPGIATNVPDGEYPITIDGKTHNIQIKDGSFDRLTS
jgi:hypothetical protein